ncbi:hypothetical protein BH11PAT4_BH11PAT4_4970 [soil metagenome]
MGFFKKTVVGIEATTAGVRVVEVEISRAPRVVSLGEALISLDEQHHGTGLDVITVSAKLEEALAIAKPRRVTTRDAYLTVPEDKVFRKILEIPASVTDAELAMVVRSEVASYLPTDLESMEIDYQVLPRRANQIAQTAKEAAKESKEKKRASEDKDDKDEKVEEKPVGQPPLYVSVVAVDKQVVQEAIALCSHTKLQPVSIDTRPAAIARAVVSPKDLDVAIVIEWHGGEAMVAVVERGVVWATGMTKAGEDTGVAAAAIADEIEHAVKFFMNRTGSTSQISQAYVVSSHVEAPGLREDLEKVMDSDTKVVEGVPVIPFPAGGDARYSAALGGALYSLYATLL